MPNQIFVIAPYWHAGTWVFDDEKRQLDKEPFVMGIPEMIDDLVQDIPNARAGFRLLFSAAPFPGYQRRVERVREVMRRCGHQCELQRRASSCGSAELHITARIGFS